MLTRTSSRQGRLKEAVRPAPSRLLLCACLAAAGLAGCTMGPDYKRPEPPLPQTFRTEAPASPDAAEVVNKPWWGAFGDPDLTALIETALISNKDLIQATMRIAEFDAKYDISRAANYPQLTYGTTTDRERRSQEKPNGLQPGADPTLSDFELNGAFQWELDLWGRIKRSNEAALADLLATQESRRAVMLTVATSVASAYVNLLELDRELELAQLSVKNRQDALDLTDLRYKGGSGTQIQVEQARALVEQEAARLPAIENQIATSENALSILLGKNPGPIKRRKLQDLQLPTVPQGVPSDVLRRRPDVLAAEQNLVAANAMIGVAKTAYFPTLSITGALGLGSDELKYLWAETARTANITAGLAGPIFNGGKIAANVREAEAVQKELTVKYHQTVQVALQEVDDSLVSRLKSSQREASISRQVGAMRKVLDLSRTRYEGGQSSYAEVLTADFRLNGAESYEAQSRRDTFLALISVYKAMGGGWMVEQDRLQAPAAAASGVQLSSATDSKAEK